MGCRLCGVTEEDVTETQLCILPSGKQSSVNVQLKRPCLGTYTNEGIMMLCELIKDSAITSLECAPPQGLLLAFYSHSVRLTGPSPTHLPSPPPQSHRE